MTKKTKIDIITLMRLQNIEMLNDCWKDLFNRFSIVINNDEKGKITSF